MAWRCSASRMPTGRGVHCHIKAGAAGRGEVRRSVRSLRDPSSWPSTPPASIPSSRRRRSSTGARACPSTRAAAEAAVAENLDGAGDPIAVIAGVRGTGARGWFSRRSNDRFPSQFPGCKDRGRAAGLLGQRGVASCEQLAGPIVTSRFCSAPSVGGACGTRRAQGSSSQAPPPCAMFRTALFLLRCCSCCCGRCSRSQSRTASAARSSRCSTTAEHGDQGRPRGSERSQARPESRRGSIEARREPECAGRRRPEGSLPHRRGEECARQSGHQADGAIEGAVRRGLLQIRPRCLCPPRRKVLYFTTEEAEGRQFTSLGDAIRDVVARKRGQPVAGIMLVTDGASNAGSEPREAAEAAGTRRHAALYLRRRHHLATRHRVNERLHAGRGVQERQGGSAHARPGVERPQDQDHAQAGFRGGGFAGHGDRR